MARVVLGDLLAARGVRVLAETDKAQDAISLIERFRPDLVLCDMALESGTGRDVIDHLAQHGPPCRVVVFTAFDEMARGISGVAVRTVIKPDFDGLERALDAAIADVSEPLTDRDRRRSIRAAASPTMRGVTGLDDAAEFYRELAEARLGDALLAVPVTEADAVDVASALRKAIRTQDLMVQRHGHLTVLLVGGGHEAPVSVLGRLAASFPAIADASSSRVVDDGRSPLDVLAELQEH